MVQTIQVSSCVSAQGDLVEHLPNGEVVIRDGDTVHRGRPVAPFVTRQAPDLVGSRPLAVARTER
jgi:hypothetical protein